MLLYTNVLRQPRLEAALSVSVRTKDPLVGNSQILRDAECPLTLGWLEEMARALGVSQAKANRTAGFQIP